MVIDIIRKYYLWLLLLLLIPGFLNAQNNVIRCQISYISNEHVYLNKGDDAGLRVGDTLKVYRNNEYAASLLIIYTSRHSASSKIIDKKLELQPGDRAEVFIKEEAENIPAAIPESGLLVSKSPGSEPDEKKQGAKINGGVSLQWYHFEDLSDNNRNFDQPTLRLRLKAGNLWNNDIKFVINARVRRNERSQSLTTGAAREEYRNRIYAFYLSYDDPGSLINFTIGRISVNRMSGIGYLDGAMLQFNLSSSLHIGGYGGLQSSWQFAGADPALQKYGLYFGYVSGTYGSRRIETTLALNTTYHDKTVNRENIYFQLNYMLNSRFTLYHTLDIDVNRSWREEKAGEKISLTALYLSARYKFSEIISGGLTFDERKNYYTYATMEIPSDFYDRSARYGLRADLYLDFAQNYSVSAYGGIRKRESDDNTTYVGRISLRKRNLFVRFLNMGLFLSGYSNYYTSGWIPSLNISKQFINGHYLAVSAGQNAYKIIRSRENRVSNWIRLNGHLQLSQNIFASASAGYDWGNDVEGYRALLELGYRF